MFPNNYVRGKNQTFCRQVPICKYLCSLRSLLFCRANSHNYISVCLLKLCEEGRQPSNTGKSDIFERLILRGTFLDLDILYFHVGNSSEHFDLNFCFLSSVVKFGNNSAEPFQRTGYDVYFVADSELALDDDGFEAHFADLVLFQRNGSALRPDEARNASRVRNHIPKLI